MKSNSCKEFKFKRENLLDVCRILKQDIKQAFKTGVYHEVNLIYCPVDEQFYLSNIRVDKLQYEGYIIYKELSFYLADNKKITIKNLMYEIFNINI